MKPFMGSVDTNKRALGLFEESHFCYNDHEQIFRLLFGVYIVIPPVVKVEFL